MSMGSGAQQDPLPTASNGPGRRRGSVDSGGREGDVKMYGAERQIRGGAARAVTRTQVVMRVADTHTLSLQDVGRRKRCTSFCIRS